jgi:phenylalanyl-tRNA synthetase beta chain
VSVSGSPGEGGWQCVAPSWRFDLRIEADLLEELARVYGYNRLPVTRSAPTWRCPRCRRRAWDCAPARLLGARDYSEAITYSFVDPDIQRLLDPDLEPVALNNPISPEHAVMRSSLLAGLLRAAQHNVKRQQARVRLFETGLRFRPAADGLSQRAGMAMLATGPVPRSRVQPRASARFLRPQGRRRGAAGLTGDAARPSSSVAGERAGLHPGQTAQVLHGGEAVGVLLGALHPTLQQKRSASTSPVRGELDLDAVLTGAYRPLPPCRASRSCAVTSRCSWIGRVPVAELLANVRAEAGQLT